MHDTSAAVPLAHTAAYQIDRRVVVADPSERQIERHIQRSAKSSLNVTVTLHAQQRMRQRQVTNPMLLEVLRLGQLALAPEADMTRAGLICRMQRYVAYVFTG